MSSQTQPAARSLPRWGRRGLGLLVVLVSLTVAHWVHCDSGGSGFRTAEGIYEPSGVAQLDDGWIVAVEDEPARPFSLLTVTDGEGGLLAKPLRSRSLLSAAVQSFADLEGITAGEDGYAYAVTSHSRKANGKRAAERELLLRFKIEDSRLAEVQVVGSLRKALGQAFPEIERAAKEKKVKRDGGLNIEGLVFDRRRRELWLGFRGPLVDDKAILVAIVNPRRVFEKGEALRFRAKPRLLDLDGGGIRGLSFVADLGGYLVLSQRDSKKKEKPFKLWLWGGGRKQPARRVRIDGVPDLRRAEAVVPVHLNGKEMILLLSDEGNFRRRKPAKYLLVDLAALNIDPQPHGTQSHGTQPHVLQPHEPGT